MKMGFNAWMRDVDEAIVAYSGLSHDDLPDCPYRNWYELGVPPQVAAKKAIRAARE